MMHVEHFEIAGRFQGPPRSGNGGYVCGRIARHLAGTVAVRLTAPPPLDTALRLETSADGARLFHGDLLLGEGSSGRLDIEPQPAPSYAAAQQASNAFIGFRKHYFPGCFVCGTARDAHDGLRIFVGSLHGTSTLAAPWTPHEGLADASGNVKSEFLWSALDCPGAFAAVPNRKGVTVILGELCASLAQPVRCGEPCIVMAWPLGVEGRKRFAGSSIHNADGKLIALARAVWMEVPLAAWT